MCSHYQSVENAARLRRDFGVSEWPAGAGVDVWPGSTSVMIRRHAHADVGDDAVPEREALAGVFGLIPHWARDATIARRTYNARSETVAEKPSFRDAWARARHCIIPAQAFFEPDWRSGRAVPTRIARADGRSLGIAGLWASWSNPQGGQVHSFTMLTINADEHPLMRHLHKPGDEKRMVVVLPESRYDDWLRADAAGSRDFLLAYPAQDLLAEPQPRESRQAVRDLFGP